MSVPISRLQANLLNGRSLDNVRTNCNQLLLTIEDI